MLYPTTCVRLRYGRHPDWSLAGFLGGMVTLAITPGRSPLCTMGVGSGDVLHCHPHNLHPSTPFSVRARRFHSRVTASHPGPAPES